MHVEYNLIYSVYGSFDKYNSEKSDPHHVFISFYFYESVWILIGRDLSPSGQNGWWGVCELFNVLCRWTVCQLRSVSTGGDGDPRRLYHMWPGQGRADSKAKWRLHRWPHDNGVPVTDEASNRSWQRLVERGTEAKHEGFNRIPSLFKTRRLQKCQDLETNDCETNQRLWRLTEMLLKDEKQSAWRRRARWLTCSVKHASITFIKMVNCIRFT